MKRLILTSSSGFSLGRTGRAESTIPFVFKFTWGELPSPQELSFCLAARSDRHGRGEHWSDYMAIRRHEGDRRDVGLIEYCETYDEIELWFDITATDQLLLVWLLDYLRSYPEIAGKLILRPIYSHFYFLSEKQLSNWKGPAIAVTDAELELASTSWHAYRSSTPEPCWAVLSRDLSALPSLRPALVQLLDELPGSNGLGTTEMRMLELVAFGFQLTNALFHLRELRGTYIFGEVEAGYLVEGLAHGPMPALAGLDDELRTLSREGNPGGRLTAFQRSRLSITDFGRAVLRNEEDFSRHNPIDRWWGGTHLTSDRMWRWQPALVGP